MEQQVEPKKPEKQMHSVGDVATVTGKCYATIHRAIKRGKIKTVRLGGSVMVPAHELRRICERGF